MIRKDKQYRTRDGREVRIYATDGIDVYSVHGAAKTPEGWWATCWTKDGKVSCSSFDASSDSDLIEVKPRIKREYWVNVYENRVSSMYPTKQDANCVADKNRIACVKVVIDCEEGEGL